VSGGAFNGVLKARAWEPSGYGAVKTRLFTGARLHAVLEHLPGLSGPPSSWEAQTTTGLYFCKGTDVAAAQRGGNKRRAIPMGEVDPVVLSEVFTDLEVLSSKA
jgi:hypothetical protein